MFCSPLLQLLKPSADVIGALERTHDESAFAPDALDIGTLGDRVSQSVAIERSSESSALFSFVENQFALVNKQFRVELSGIEEPLVLIRYGAGGRLDWHLDCGPGEGARRKLSLTIQLSSGSDYVGGDLEFAGVAPHPLARDRFMSVAFPSYLAHRVTPVKAGTREALVAWIHGPTYR